MKVVVIHVGQQAYDLCLFQYYRRLTFCCRYRYNALLFPFINMEERVVTNHYNRSLLSIVTVLLLAAPSLPSLSLSLSLPLCGVGILLIRCYCFFFFLCAVAYQFFFFSPLLFPPLSIYYFFYHLPPTTTRLDVSRLYLTYCNDRIIYNGKRRR